MTSLVFQTNNTCVLFYLKISKSVNICFPLIYVKLTVSLSYFFHSNSALLIFPYFFLLLQYVMMVTYDVTPSHKTTQ